MAAGEFVGLLGANNAGKSTLINCVSAILRLSSGKIMFEGREISKLSPHAIVAQGIIQVPEGRQVFPQMSVLDNLLTGGIAARAKHDRPAQLEQVFELAPRLAERRPQAAGTLSGGEQQMLAIGRALMAKPRLLMLDEPSLGLSPKFVEIIFEALTRINRAGLTVLCVEQNLNLTLSVASRGIVLERGEVALEGPCDALRDDPRTQRAYFGLGD
jgi:branched-chain amino acid transport system ATP-binding protein